MSDWKILAILLGIALAESIALLVVLNTQLRPIYGEIWAWRFIFLGYVLLAVEIVFGLALILGWSPVYTRFFNIGFCVIMDVKVAAYLIGYLLWARKRRELLDPRRWKTEKGKQAWK